MIPEFYSIDKKEDYSDKTYKVYYYENSRFGDWYTRTFIVPKKRYNRWMEVGFREFGYNDLNEAIDNYLSLQAFYRNKGMFIKERNKYGLGIEKIDDNEAYQAFYNFIIENELYTDIATAEKKYKQYKRKYILENIQKY